MPEITVASDVLDRNKPDYYFIPDNSQRDLLSTKSGYAVVRGVHALSGMAGILNSPSVINSQLTNHSPCSL